MEGASGLLQLAISLRSEDDQITVEWFVPPNVDQAAARSALSDFVDRRSLVGPPPRLELPDGHPDRNDYVYDAASTFRYLDLVVVLDRGHPTVNSHYGKDLAGVDGANGPLRPWAEFMSVVRTEIDRRGAA